MSNDGKMSRRSASRLNEEDLIAAGFHRLEQKPENNPPKINWGVIYRQMSTHQKIQYLEKLAASMNHAAHLLQMERNQWAELASKKEAKLIEAQRAMQANNAMVQQEITKMNEERQHYNLEIKKLRDEIRDLRVTSAGKEVTCGGH